MYEVAGFGNALLDITVTIKTKELLNKYNLNEDDQKEISVSDMRSLYNDISKFPKEMNPGGCAQNTLRILQWLLNEPNKTLFYGAIGDDEQGRILKELVDAAGVCTKYNINEGQNTGQCIALVSGTNRSLVANLDAAESFCLSTLTNEETTNVLKTVKIIYLEGFFLPNRLDAAYYIRDFALSNKLVFCFNLCGQYLCNMLPKHVLEFAKSCHFLFGNRKEFLSIGKLLNKNNLIEIGLELNKGNDNPGFRAQNPLLRFGKVVVITGGHENVLCVYGDGVMLEINVSLVPLQKIRDTTGAGDSFVSGFFAGFLRNYSIRECLDLGCWTSARIIQEIGCSVPQYSADIANIR